MVSAATRSRTGQSDIIRMTSCSRRLTDAGFIRGSNVHGTFLADLGNSIVCNTPKIFCPELESLSRPMEKDKINLHPHSFRPVRCREQRVQSDGEAEAKPLGAAGPQGFLLAPGALRHFLQANSTSGGPQGSCGRRGD